MPSRFDASSSPPADADFDPFHLTPDASLNRTRIAPLSGANPRWPDRPAFDLLSLQALLKLAEHEGFPAIRPPETIIAAMTTACAARDATAVRVIEVFGRRLAHLIATLTISARIAPEDSLWRAAYLRYWSQIEHVWIGGGLAAALGDVLLSATRTEAARLGATCRIDVAPHAAVLALLGAARSRQLAVARVAVLDFGHSTVKRGIATVSDGSLTRLDLLPGRPTPTLDAEANVDPTTEFVLDTVSDTILTARRMTASVDSRVMIALASYLSRTGRPLDTHSIYAPLGALEPQALDASVSRRTGTRVELEFLHDGSAAARGLPPSPDDIARTTSHGRDAHARNAVEVEVFAPAPALDGRRRAAVIVLGTALAAGFAPPPATLLPAAHNVVVAAATPSA